MKLSITDFKHHSEFTSKKAYNSNNELFLAVHKKDLTRTEYIAFKQFIRMACNVKSGVFGITFASIKTIATYVGEFLLNVTGVSRSTVKRMLKKLKEFGLIEVVERKGKNGRQTSNLYIFKKFGQAETRAEVVAESDTIEPPQTEGKQVKPAPAKEKDFRQLNHHNTSNLFNTNNHLNIRTANENLHIINNIDLGKDFVNKDIPEQFTKLASCYYGNFQTIEEYWKMVKIAAKNAGYEVAEYDLIAVAKDALKTTIKALKLHEVRKNVFAFFYGTMQKMLRNLYDEFYKPEEPFFNGYVPAIKSSLPVETIEKNIAEQNRLDVW